MYIHFLLEKTVLVINDPDDVIQVEAELKASSDPRDLCLPINATWRINLRNTIGAVVDNIQISFVDGRSLFAYRYAPGLPLGDYRINRSDIDPIIVDGVTYQILLASPVRFTLTRQLAEM